MTLNDLQKICAVCSVPVNQGYICYTCDRLVHRMCILGKVEGVWWSIAGQMTPGGGEFINLAVAAVCDECCHDAE